MSDFTPTHDLDDEERRERRRLVLWIAWLIALAIAFLYSGLRTVQAYADEADPDPDASAASASSAPWSIEFFAAAGVRLPRDGVFLEFL